ncbi:MAG: N-6 DNA methylase [Phycisphaerae bacterium]
MLDIDTRRRIDNCRDILVGKVPDPKSQVEQITIALIYKFMDDLDKQSIEWGGKPSFFVGDFGKYGWSNIFDPRIGGFELLNLYAEALVKMNHNPNIPQLFRDIFKNAFLPYRDPETLKSFLKEISQFSYSHSEQLGNAYEYLLSIMSSQGDAGQFRTPRHIIDFIVQIVAPQKHETILDPACGTAGFLISAFKYILQTNPKLTPDHKKRLLTAFVGYDISPDMVRLSLVNLYLHGFADPKIHEYDTLTSLDRWDESFDVILANPPFMSPKGGIRPHNRFSIPAKRSEVLFVDYIAEHLNPSGRAGIIVPEGIIFQSQNAYKQLRKMLVENCLWAVVSLPAGIFKPYSGVKTSILLMDKNLAKRTKDILFVRVSSDGFDLGDQRRENPDKNDLPEAEKILREYRQTIDKPKKLPADGLGLVVPKSKIMASDDCSLSGERYRENFTVLNHKWPVVELGGLCETVTGGTPATNIKEYYEGGTIPWLRSGEVSQGSIEKSELFITKSGLDNSSAKILPINSVLVALYGATAGKVGILKSEAAINQAICGILPNERVSPDFLYWVLSQETANLVKLTTGGAQQNLSQGIVRRLKIPLPPLEVQRAIVAEVEGYQKIIDGARQVVQNYKPALPLDPAWPLVELGEMAKNLDGKRKPVTKSDRNSGKYPYYGASGIVDYVDDYIFDEDLLLISEDGANLLSRSTPIAFSVNGKVWVNNHAHVLRFTDKATQLYVEMYLNGINIELYVTGSAQPKLNQENLNRILIPLPPFDVQKVIVTKIEEEQGLVAANRRLIDLFEQKIKTRVASLWEGK